MISENEISGLSLDCAIRVHKSLGPGLLESAYEECLYYEIAKRGLIVEKQKALPLVYEDVRLDIGYRVDLLVENKVVLEIKSVDCFTDIHLAQVLTYLKLSSCKLGLLLNFNVALMKNGIRRIVNRL